MSRFSEPQDPTFQALNSSIALRLAPGAVRHRAVARARADARPAGDHRRRRRRRAGAGARGRARGGDRRAVRVPARGRGRPHGDRAARDRARGRRRRQAPHGALAQRPGGHRRRDVRARAHAHDARPGEGADGARSSSSPTRTSTGRCPATRICSARSPSTSAITCWRTSGASRATSSGSSSACSATDRLPLGAGALAGVNFDTDREWVAAELGFEGVVENSMDAVSNRDFVLDFVGAAATCGTHLSQLGAEIVLWSSDEFGFCEVADAFASGSSIMPQKKNPDAAELLRAKAPRIVGRLVGAPRRAARAAADLQQGPPGGQGGAVRRRRHARALPLRRHRDARRHPLPARAARAGRRRTRCSPRPTSPTCS